MIMNKKILLSGGGTMGSVSPLLAVAAELQKRDPSMEFLFVGTQGGPEKETVESYKIPFRAIASGKLRRYADPRNFSDPFRILKGFFQARKIIKEFKPDAVMVAGAYVGVPLAWAAKFRGVPVLVHQQDIETGLANKLMANAAKKITVSFDVSLRDFPADKVVLTGNPLREEFYECDKEASREFFHLRDDQPVVLITGGGTGSKNINDWTIQALPKIVKFAQVIHTTGSGKSKQYESENYHQYEFLKHEMPEALCVADLVVCRAGLSTLTELAMCGKPAVIIPMLATHQEHNAAYYRSRGAAVVLSEASLNAEVLAGTLRDLLSNKEKLASLSENIKKIMPADGAARVADVLIGIIK